MGFLVKCEVPVSMGDLYAAKKGPTPGYRFKRVAMDGLCFFQAPFCTLKTGIPVHFGGLRPMRASMNLGLFPNKW